MYTHICVHMYVCMYVCVCIYIYTHTYIHIHIHLYTYTYILASINNGDNWFNQIRTTYRNATNTIH